jgi:murein L,D-transpeptidase YcbB/YkuD
MYMAISVLSTREQFKNHRGRFIFLWCIGLVLGCLSGTAKASDSAYQRLEDSLPLYEAAAVHPWPRLNLVKNLSVGMHDPTIAVLRQRLCATHDLPATACNFHPNETYFDESLEEAVAFFQKRHGLVSDGIVGELTQRSLNVSPKQRVQQIQLNLQRWSRLIGLAESAYIWINIPDHQLRLIKDHHVILISRIIVGKLSRQTPEINSQVTRIILNPYWTVPPGMARRDVIPEIIKNKNYLQQHRMKVFAANQPNVALNPDEVDWLAIEQNPSRIILRQEPGPHNALGQIKFEFSNPHLVYLHDTPAKHLFGAERRLFSSGCVRMEDPFYLLEALAQLDPSLKQAEPQIEAALESGKTTAIQLAQPIPIHLTYITAWVDRAGMLYLWDDVYGLDSL